MFRGLTAVAIIVALVPVAAGVPLAFDTPAQLGGDIELQGGTLLLAPLPGAKIMIAMHEAGSRVIHHEHRTGASVNVGTNFSTTARPASNESTSQTPFLAELTSRENASLWLTTKQSMSSLKGAAGELVHIPENNNYYAVVGGSREADRFRTAPLADGAPGVGTRLLGAFGPALQGQVHAVARSVEWHGMDVVCIQGPCPPGGVVTPLFNVGNPTASASVDRYTFIHLGGQLLVRLDGPLAFHLQVGSAITVNATGWARLPAAVGVDDLALDGDQTVRLDGIFSLADLRRGEPGRLEGNVRLHAAAIRVDEQWLEPIAALPAAAAGLVLAALLAKLASVVAPLVAQVAPERVLEHPKRRSIMTYVRAHPVATFRELVRETGIMSGTARHHVIVLTRSGVLEQRRHRETLRFFDATAFDESWSATVLLREEPLRQLHDWLAAHPGRNQKVIVGKCQEWGWSRSTAQHRLKRLVAEGMVMEQPRGRHKVYGALAEHGAAPSPRAVSQAPNAQSA